ncbi:MAG: GTP cyclohydrolase I FolE [Prevotellaceae bacterium]|nr:GTP cyclohydrolase I FolE [Candidatus Colivivens caballi]
MILTQYEPSALETLKQNVADVLTTVGEDINREGLVNTPERVAKCILQFTSGYNIDPVAILNSAKFKEDYSKPVVIKDIEFYSLCEHHMLPFFGKVHVAYIPDGQIVGLSKIPRVVDTLSRRLQVQERLTRELCQCIQQALQPRGVMVVIEAQHMCMQMRGVEKQGATTVTSDYSGDFSSPQMREEFYNQIRGDRK